MVVLELIVVVGEDYMFKSMCFLSECLESNMRRLYVTFSILVQRVLM